MAFQKPVRAAYYLRISTEEQEMENQRGEIMPFIDRRGWKGSGAIPRKCMFYQRMVFWVLCRQDCGPKLGSGYYFFGQRSDVELIFLYLLCQLYTADRHDRRLESLESEHRPDSLFYPAMVLLDYVVQVFRGANPYPAR